MTKPSEKLAGSLEALAKLQKGGVVAIKSRDLSRVHRERLIKNGFLKEVVKGWYIPTKPEELKGESTAWYASYWDFCASYLTERFGNQWCLSPEQSLLLHTGNFTVPRQLLVRSPKGHNNFIDLPHGTSIMDVRSVIPKLKEIEEKNGLRIFALPAALIASSPTIFTQNSLDVRTALAMIRDSSEILDRLLEGGHTVVAGRIAGAFRNIGQDRIANEIIETMRAADYDVRESDPFQSKIPFLGLGRGISPYVNRISLMWQEMRQPILDRFPKVSVKQQKIKEYLEQVEETYITDAYHSLSIEGYQVNRKLIERVRSGIWNPDAEETDRENLNALAARGYYLAFQKVKNSIERVLKKENPGLVADEDHGVWYREMFAPSVTAGLLKTSNLAGYRNGPVYIRKSKHVPPSADAVRDLMPAFFELLKNEDEPAVRVVLGHFVFVYIHPYTDGNGRIGRFLMNLMLASGGYPWTVIPLERRDNYMAALEAASVDKNILPFTDFLGSLVSDPLAVK